MNPFAVLTLGFVLGLKHATDADHVVAVTTMVARQKNLKQAAVIGATWGIGHTIMIMVVGIFLILFKLSIPDSLQQVFELIVAAALIILGILNLTGKATLIHTHDVTRPFVVGLIHGLAGSSAVALLILGSITDQTIAVIYLGIFGVGTIVGMMLTTTLLGVPILTGNKTFANFERIAGRIAGCVSIVYGLSIAFTISQYFST